MEKAADMSHSRRLAALVGVAAVLCAVPSAASASPRSQQPPPRNDGAAISPGEVQRMFDAYALMRAEEQLSLRDDQTASFLSRFKALQDARRARVQEHGRLVQELRMLRVSACSKSRWSAASSSCSCGRGRVGSSKVHDRSGATRRRTIPVVPLQGSRRWEI